MANSRRRVWPERCVYGCSRCGTSGPWRTPSRSPASCRRGSPTRRTRGRGRRAAARALPGERPARGAAAPPAGARARAADALVGVISRQLYAGEIGPAIGLARELIARCLAETDPVTVAGLGRRLEEVFLRLSESSRPIAQALPTWLAARVPSFHTATPTRPRLRPVAWEIARLDCAAHIDAVLTERFGDDPAPDRRALALRSPPRRAFLAGRLGRFLACSKILGGLDSASISATVDTARPVAPGRYAYPVWVAALFGSTIDLGAGPEADRTRAAITTILAEHRMNGPTKRFARHQVRTMNAPRRRATA